MSPRSLLSPLWLLRVLWLVAPIITGPAIADSLADRNRRAEVVVSVVAWVAWAATLVALAVPRSATLTAIRIVAPGGALFALWAAVDAGGVAGVIGSAALVAAAGLALSSGVADVFVDGSSYGAESRVALRVPAALVLPAVLAWMVVCAAVAVPVAVASAGHWGVALAAAVVGGALGAVLALRLHQLSRRWLVFVPAGLVIHDPLTLAEPLLLQRHLVDHVGPARVDSDEEGVDLTGGALGLAVEIGMRTPVALGRRQGRDTVELDQVTRLVVTPGRPAVTLERARGHRLAVR